MAGKPWSYLPRAGVFLSRPTRYMRDFNEAKVNRQASGTSAGGQFANKDHPANDDIGLDDCPSIRRDAVRELLEEEGHAPWHYDMAALDKFLPYARDEDDALRHVLDHRHDRLIEAIEDHSMEVEDNYGNHRLVLDIPDTSSDDRTSEYYYSTQDVIDRSNSASTLRQLQEAGIDTEEVRGSITVGLDELSGSQAEVICDIKDHLREEIVLDGEDYSARLGVAYDEAARGKLRELGWHGKEANYDQKRQALIEAQKIDQTVGEFYQEFASDYADDQRQISETERVWQNQFNQLAEQAKPWVVDLPDGTQGIKPDAPKSVTEPYQEMMSVGYVQGWL